MFSQYNHLPLKSQQRQLTFPQMELPLASMEVNFILSAQEAIVSKFKQNKRFIEKELSTVFNQAKKMKKSTKDNAEASLEGIHQINESLAILKTKYASMVQAEDALINALQERLLFVSKVA